MTQMCPDVGDAEFSLILPRYDNSGNKIRKSSYGDIIRALNDRFGGTSSHTLGGCVVLQTGETQCEGNVVIKAARDFDAPWITEPTSCDKREAKLRDDNKFIESQAKKAAERFGQESVFFSQDRPHDVAFALGKKRAMLTERIANPNIRSNPERLFEEIF